MNSVLAKIEELRPWSYEYTNNGKTITSDDVSISAPLRELTQGYRKSIVRHILNVIQPRLPEFNSLRVLDMGCAEGFYSDILCSFEFQEVVSVELSKKMLARARFLLQEFRGWENSTIIEGNVLDHELMTSLGQFDIIFFHGLLYHLHSPVMAFVTIEELIRNKHAFFLLLSYRYNMEYNLMVHQKPLAEVHVRPSDWLHDENQGIVYDPVAESAFDKIASMVNGKALYKILQSFRYKEIITYDTPPELETGAYFSRLVLSKVDDENLLPDLNTEVRQNSTPALRFYRWTGSSADSYSFRRHIKSVLVRLTYGMLDRVTRILTFLRL